jgi:hypothetical protein
MTEWLVRLKGHVFDLEELSDRFTSADRNVKKDEDGHYYLRSSDFDQMSDPDTVSERAQDLIAYMNGAVKLLSAVSYRTVEFDVVTRVDDSGNRHHHITLSATVEGRSRMTATPSVGGTGGTVNAPPPPSGADSLVNLADQNAKVAAALRFYARSDWFNLYKAWEVVRDAAGGEPELIKKGWATKAQKRRFTGTAQSPAELGDEARHASEESQPPKNPMSLEEAQGFVRSVIEAWIRTL